MLQVSGLSLAEGKVPHLADVTATFARGQLTTLLGRTGAGKTTLMRVIAGLQMPASGEVLLDGQAWQRLPPWKRPVAMVTQQFINYPHLSVLDNVAFPLLRAGAPRAAALAAARDMLGRVGLAAMVDRRPGALSGGQQQRVAIARALVKKAPVLLLDEPFVNLDYKLREGLREELVELLRAASQTIVIYASTDPREALQMGDRIVLMAEGRVVQAGLPRTVYDAPHTLTAALVVNDPPLNALPLVVDAAGVTLGSLGRQHLRRPLPPGTYTLGLRAQDVTLGGPLQARVVLSEVSGSETVTHLDCGDQALIMQEKTVADHPLGAILGLTLNLDRALVFNAQGLLLEADHG